MPRVSVVIPAYNVEAYIEASLGSVLQQTYADFEVIVVDDGSRDGTVERACRFADPRIRIVSQANRGLAGARNGGIRAARGEFVAFLDADDLWHPQKLARHVEHLDRCPQVGVSYSRSAFIDATGQPLGLQQRPKLRDVRAHDVFLRNPVGNGSAPVLRTALLADIAYRAPTGAPGELWYFDETFRQSEDIECWTRIALTTGWRFEGIGALLTLYRVNDGGLSADVDKQLASWERMLARTATYAPQFVACWGDAARAFQLRYLARRAVRSGAPRAALALLWRALKAHPRMLREEPARTAITAGAALAQTVLPRAAYHRLEAAAMQLAGRAVSRGAA